MPVNDRTTTFWPAFPYFHFDLSVSAIIATLVYYWIYVNLNLHSILFRQNVSASGARPNPQGSFHYGSINVTETYVIKIVPPVQINGTLRATLNGISFVNPNTPIRLADQYKVKGEYKLDFPSRPLNRTPRIDRSVINATYKGFIEVIFQNNDTVMQSFHVDGYSFFVIGYESFLCLNSLSLP